MAFSIKQLLFSMAVIAFAIVAINVDKPVFGKLFDVMTLGIIIAAAYGAWLATGKRRAFRIGFFCWAILYFVLVKKKFDLGTDDLLRLAYRELLAPPINIPSGQLGLSGGGGFLGAHPNFFPVCHSLMLLLLGVVGGCITAYFYQKRQQMLEPGMP